MIGFLLAWNKSKKRRKKEGNEESVGGLYRLCFQGIYKFAIGTCGHDYFGLKRGFLAIKMSRVLCESLRK